MMVAFMWKTNILILIAKIDSFKQLSKSTLLNFIIVTITKVVDQTLVS